jgi:hypothetical protein
MKTEPFEMDKNTVMLMLHVIDSVVERFATSIAGPYERPTGSGGKQWAARGWLFHVAGRFCADRAASYDADPEEVERRGREMFPGLYPSETEGQS